MARRAKTAARGSTKRSKGGVSINWGEAEIGNRLSKEGTYLFKVTAAEEGDNDNVVIDAEVISDKQTGKTVRTYFQLAPQALWKLAQFLEAAGEEIPDSEADLDLEALVDREFVGVVQEHEYNDKIYMRIQNFYPADEFEGEKGAEEADDDADEKPARRGRKAKEEADEKPARGRKGKKDEPEKIARDEVENMDRDELIELITDKDLETDPDDFKKLPKLLEAILEELETKDLLEEAEVEEKPTRRSRKGRAEPEEEEKPTRGRKDRKASKSLPKVTADDVEDMKEEELEDLVDKYGLDIDLDQAKTLRKKAALVLDALEEKELLETE